MRWRLTFLSSEVFSFPFPLYVSYHNYSIGRFVATAMALKEEFGLSLFGFDVIIPANSSSTPCKTLDPLQKELVIIDINFFPSYKEVSDFPQRLCDFLKKKATHKL